MKRLEMFNDFVKPKIFLYQIVQILSKIPDLKCIVMTSLLLDFFYPSGLMERICYGGRSMMTLFMY